MLATRKYGKSSLSTSLPGPVTTFSDIYPANLNPSAPTNENVNPRATEPIFGGISASFDSSIDPQGSRRRVQKAKKINLDTAMSHGHPDDLAFLLSKVTAENPHVIYMGISKISFHLPKEWSYQEQNRCRTWLVDQLGFEERLFANEPAYVHLNIKPIEFQTAILKTPRQIPAPNLGLVLEIPQPCSEDPQPRSRPTSLTISRVPSLDSLGRGGSVKRPISRMLKDGEDSDSDGTGKESPAFLPNQGAFSPKTCRTSRTASSPHFNLSANNSLRSPRALASPADAILAGFERVRIGGDSQEEVRVTRSRNNSYNAGVVVTTRSRGNSDSTAGDSTVSTAKSRAGSVDFSRSNSRMGAPIQEESKEDMEKEEEDEELVAAFPEPFLASSTAMQMDGCMDVAAPSTEEPPRVPEPSFLPAAAHSPPLPVQRQGSAQRMGYQAQEDAAVLSDAPTECSSSSDDEFDGDNDLPMGLASGASNEINAPRSPVASVSSFGMPLNGLVRLPPAPHELARAGPQYQAALRGGSPTELQRTGVQSILSGVSFARSIAEPPLPNRAKRSTSGGRGATNLTRAHTAPVQSSEESPGATVPALGAPASQPIHLCTPQAVRAYTDVVENYQWEVSTGASLHVLRAMRETVKVELARYRALYPQENFHDLVEQPRQLMRSVSESQAGHRERSPPRNRDSGFMPLFDNFRSSGRDSVGSIGSHDGAAYSFHALINDRRISDQYMQHMCDDQESIIGHNFSAAKEAVRARLSGSSMLGAASPQMAFDPYSPSPKHSPGGFGIASNVPAYPTTHTMRHVHIQDTSSARKNKKLFNSKAKLRRMSLAPQMHTALHAPHHMQSIAETSLIEDAFSPAAKMKCLSDVKSRNRRRLSTIFAKQNTSELIGEPSFQSHHSGCDFDLSFGNGSGAGDNSGVCAHDAHLFLSTSCLNELNFKGVVIGGVYQHCFDNASPLVAAPTGSDKRVSDVAIQNDNSLVLSLYLPREKKTERINLGAKWQWMRCSPTGYLAFSAAIQPHQSAVCYFLPKHPDDWNKQVSSGVAATMGSRNRRVSIVPLHEYNPRPRTSPSARLHTNSLEMEMEMDYQPFVDIPAIEGDDDGLGCRMQADSADELNLSTQQADTEDTININFAGLELTENIIDATSEHKSNASMMAQVLDFLIDDIALFGAVTAAASAKKTANEPVRRRSQRKDSGAEHTRPTAEHAVLQLQAIQGVSKTWALAAYMVIAKRKSSLATAGQLSFDYSRFLKFSTKFQDGKYLSEGVCKNVYCVLNPATSNLEAVSVMDVEDLLARGMDVAITQELQISLLCSSLVNLKICPNLVQVYSLFQADFDAPLKLWDGRRSLQDLRNMAQNGTVRKQNTGLRKADLTAGRFQYIRMEFCSGGDVEERVRAIQQPDIRDVQAMFFQMCFSLYACREKLCMRHFDIKLLNFFITTKDILHQNQSAAKASHMSGNSTTNLQVGLGQHVYNIPLCPGDLSLIKLADFGTSAVGASGLGDPITMQQFTTLENSPPEFLLMGSWARQSYASDTFPLGLCLFHLLTGYAPYEELLKDVHCPAYLATLLRDIWLTEDINSPFYLIHQVVITLDVSDGAGFDNADASFAPEEPENVLLDTLYRYMVLFGLGDAFAGDNAARSVYADSPVWQALFDALDLKRLHARIADKELERAPRLNANGKSRSFKGNSAKDDCALTYQKHAQLWSMHIGNHGTMTSFRQRVQALGNGADELLESLLHFDPARRCTMYDALQHPVFASLRLPTGNNNSSYYHPEAHNAHENAVRFMHYYRGGAGQQGENILPIL